MIGYLIYPATTPRTNNAFSWFCDAAMQNGIELKVFFTIAHKWRSNSNKPPYQISYSSEDITFLWPNGMSLKGSK